MKYLFLSLIIYFLFSFQIQAQTEVDDYPVTDNMFDLEFTTSPLKINDVYSIENWWFKNDSLQENLVFNLATDFHRFQIFHFKKNEVPDEIMQRIYLAKKENNEYVEIKDSSRTESFKLFQNNAKSISSKYFKSKHGYTLGLCRPIIIKIHDNPDSTYFDGKYKVLVCKYTSDPKFSKSKIKPQPKYVKNSFGYEVKMYFKDGILIGMILVNEMP